MSMINDSSLGSPLAAQSGNSEQSILRLRPRSVRLIIVVEGFFDIQFLMRVSRIIHNHDSKVPDLLTLEKSGEILFLPIAGSNFLHWTDRLAGLGVGEFHLLDREVSPLTEERERSVELVNRRPGCRAVLTGKRAIENYLSPLTLKEVRGIDIQFGDHDDVPQLAASCLLKQVGGPDWWELASRSRRRLRNLAKKWLNTDAVDGMTFERLVERDKEGDIQTWLASIAELLG